MQEYGFFLRYMNFVKAPCPMSPPQVLTPITSNPRRFVQTWIARASERSE